MATLNYAFKELSCKIVYYGCGLCGKTTNLIHIHKTVPQRFRGELVSLATEQDRTLFFDFLPLDLGEVKGFKTKFQLYTVPGQVYYNATRKLVLRGVDGLVFVVDSQKDRFQENIDSLENLKQNLSEYGYRLQESPTDYEGIPWVIQYNKRDMPQVSTVDELQGSVNEHGLPCFEAVAVSGQGVKDTLKGISSLVIKKLNADPGGVGGSGEIKKEEKPAAAISVPVEVEDAPEPVAEAPAAKAGKTAAPTPEPAAPAAPVVDNRPPQLNVVQKCSARVLGLSLGGGNLSLSNITGGDGKVYQLTGKLAFLGVFGSTWSRRVRFQESEERTHAGEQAQFFRFTSDDGSTPAFELFIKDDFDKSMFIKYPGKFGQVSVAPSGKQPLA